MKLHLYILGLLLTVSFAAQSQFNNLSNLRKKKIAATGVVKLDSLNIVPNSIILANADTSFYSLDPIQSLFTWKKKYNSDSAIVFYRVFSFKLNMESKRLSYDSIKNNFIISSNNLKKNNNNNVSLFDFGAINYNGSFGKSISVGNTQDAVFNSQLNLQLSGMIGDSIMLSAAITDNNIPIQPDGTTQQLNEFDKILIQFKKKDWEIDLGDIDIRENKNYFLNFYKRVQGIAYEQKTKIGKDGYNKLFTGGAIAKGIFTRNIFQGSEGNQGPYKLTGANNEVYFVVLANTEKVFIDGEVMQRGQDQDYVINYNTAEVTFTSKRLITKDTRIQVEFEYADNYYLNTVVYVSDELAVNKKLKFNIALYNNADAKNSPISQTLDNQQIQFLASLGDSIQNAYYPVASVDSFSSSAILYKKIDTVVNGIHDSIFVYSTNPDSAIYNLNFVSVGNNKGNYVSLFNGVNGIVYEWVAPINGVLQGSYEPATFLVTPKKQQIVSVGSEYAIDSTTLLKTELALSNYDVNTFSKIGKSNDVGYAGKIELTRKKEAIIGNKQYQVNTDVGYEWIDERFKPLEPLHNVEFFRDWGLDLQTPAATENIPSFNIKLSDKKNNSLEYTLDGYFRSDGYKGILQTLQEHEKVSTWQFNSKVSLTDNSNTIASTKGYYIRPTFDISKTLERFNHYVIGVNYSIEHNEQRYTANDSLNATSYAFETFSAYLKSNPAKKNNWAFTYTIRNDQLPSNKTLLQTTRSDNYNLQIGLLQSKNQQLRINITYRELFVSDTILTAQRADNSLLGRIEYNIKGWNGFITGNTLYEIGSGQEQQKNYSYVQVPAGQGQYTWIDYNHDGIQQLNEFVIAAYSDQAIYIRVYTPTNNYIKTNYIQFNYSIALNPKVICTNMDNKKMKDFISRFTLQSSLQTNKKVLAEDHPVFNPFSNNIVDTALVTLTYALTNTVSFNRQSRKWGLDLSQVTNNSTSFLSYGLESHHLNEWSLKSRFNIGKQYTVALTQKVGSNELLAAAYTNSSYRLSTFSEEPTLTYTNGTLFRMQLSYQYSQKENAGIDSGGTSKNNSLSLETKYTSKQSAGITAKFTYSGISYTGTGNSTLSYIMLDGLSIGQNYIWNIEFSKRLMKNLELNLNYEGRKAAGSQTVNTGRASIRALL